MLDKILCAIDGSESARRAVDFAVKLAASFGSELRFITVATVSPESASRSVYWDTELYRAGASQIADELADAMAAAKKAGVANASSVTAHGRDVAAAIIGYAGENGFDHIVMGSTGHTAFGRLLAGSVVDDVLGRKHPPVTVV